MEQQNERIAYHEFHTVNPLLLREVLETGIVLECSCSRFDPVPNGRRGGRSRLRQSQSDAQQWEAELSNGGPQTTVCRVAGQAGARRSLRCHGILESQLAGVPATVRQSASESQPSSGFTDCLRLCCPVIPDAEVQTSALLEQGISRKWQGS
jgi:hypothetical protein